MLGLCVRLTRAVTANQQRNMLCLVNVSVYYLAQLKINRREYTSDGIREHLLEGVLKGHSQ